MKHNCHTRIHTVIVIWLLLNAGFVKMSVAARSEKPNFLFFISDDLNKEYYGCYGHDKSPAPTTSRLAREGMVFDNAFTGQAICAPSRSMIYTGKYPLRNGAFMNHTPVYKGTRSLCHYMQELAYDVILCGKSHVKPDTAFPWTITMPSVDPSGDTGKYTRPALPTSRLETYFAEGNKNNERPFCIMATSYYPHGEHPPKSDFSEKNVEVTRFEEGNEGNRKSEAHFYQAIKNSDDEFARVLDLLDKYDLAENTVVLYVSDHGRFGKFSVYDRGLNVPFVVRWPGVVKAGSRSDALVSFADILPTMLDLAGAQAVKDLDGKSFAPVLKGQADTHHDYVYGVMTNQGIINAHVFPGRMVRSKQYKYIRNYNALEVVERRKRAGEDLNPFLELGARKHPGVPEEELFDLLTDPQEQHDLAADPAYRDIKAKLKQVLQAWLIAQGDFLIEGCPMPLLAVKRQFRLDLRHPKKKRRLPPGMKNSLASYDFYVHKPCQISVVGQNGMPKNIVLRGSRWNFGAGALQSFKGWQYAAYWDDKRQVSVARRKLPDGPWSVLSLPGYERTENVNRGKAGPKSRGFGDGHEKVTMGISPDGIIHLAFDHHVSTLHYRASREPIALNPKDHAWEARSFTSVQDHLGGPRIEGVTYPVFTSDDQGMMLYLRLGGGSGSGNSHFFYYEAGQWRENSEATTKLIDKHWSGGNGTVNAYPHALVMTAKRWHLTWCWRDTPDAQTCHDLCYAYSEDRGHSWKNNAGATVAVTGETFITADTPGISVWSIAPGTRYINGGSMCVDETGRVHVLMRGEEGSPVYFRRDPITGQWTRQRSPISGSLIAGSGDALYLVSEEGVQRTSAQNFGNMETCVRWPAARFQDSRMTLDHNRLYADGWLSVIGQQGKTVSVLDVCLEGTE